MLQKQVRVSFLIEKVFNVKYENIEIEVALKEDQSICYPIWDQVMALSVFDMYPRFVYSDWCEVP